MDANGQLGRWDLEGAETQLLAGAQLEELVHTELRDALSYSLAWN